MWLCKDRICATLKCNIHCCVVLFLHSDQVPHSAVADLDANLHECVKTLNGYIFELRTYLRRYPWLEGVESQTPASDSDPAQDTAIEEEWEMRSIEVR